MGKSVQKKRACSYRCCQRVLCKNDRDSFKEKDVVKSKVRGVDLEFDHEKLATILGVPGKNGIYEYIKEVWEESKYTKPLEITRRFANDDTIMKARRVKSVEMKPSQRKDHELPYGDWLTMVFEAFGVPLVDKKGEEPKRYDFFEETFLTMCKLTRESGIWWIGSGENRRRDDDEEAPEEEAEDENEGNQDDFDWKAVIDEATVEGESGSDDQFYDAQVEVEEPDVKHQARPSSSSFIFSSAERSRTFRSRPLGSYSRKSRISKFQRSLKERGQTDFMMNWRRPKLRMPNF
ncbi:hypothetical protein Dimus_029037 [Dionaea muscipula]